MSKQASMKAPSTTTTDRFKVRKTLALVSMALIGIMVIITLAVIVGGTEAAAERVLKVSGFGGVLVGALVSIILGYGVSTHMDDKHHIDRGLPPPGDNPATANDYSPIQPNTPLEQIRPHNADQRLVEATRHVRGHYSAENDIQK